MNYAKKDQILSDFDKLIKFYSHKSKEYFDDMQNNLFLFLLELIREEKCISKRYIAVCLRNEYIRISKQIFIYKTEKEFTEFCIKNNFDCDFENQVLFLDTLKTVLNSNEKEIISLRFIDGFTFQEIARLKGVSRQAIFKTQKTALDKLKPFM